MSMMSGSLRVLQTGRLGAADHLASYSWLNKSVDQICAVWVSQAIVIRGRLPSPFAAQDAMPRSSHTRTIAPNKSQQRA